MQKGHYNDENKVRLINFDLQRKLLKACIN